MMRSYEQSNPRGRLVRGAGTVLHHAVEALQSGRDDHDSVRRSLRSLCHVARSQGILAEELILICKNTWRALPEAREFPADAGNEMLSRVVTRCIDEYYRTDGEDISSSRRPPVATSVPEASLSFMFGPLS